MTLLLAVLIPLIFGLTLLFLKEKNELPRNILLFSGEILCLVLLLSAVFLENPHFTLFSFWDGYRFSLACDKTGLLFAFLGATLFLAVSFFALKYMQKEEHKNRFFAFLLCALGCYTGMCFAENLLSFYLFFEFLTLTTFPLVLHEQTPEAILGAKKYLFYSMGGALLAMGGILLLLSDAGKTADSFSVPYSEGLTNVGRWGVFLTVVGFSAKAGMFPLQSWLPSAHPVCPAPASALLSGLIVKAGILGILRVSYFSVDASFLRNTPFQTVLICLALFTVVCASTRAYFEPVLKKRLAYSTVSNLSYILLGLFLFSKQGLQGALLHTVAHAFAKTMLFLCAGEIIFRTGKTKVEDLAGYGRKMPAVFLCFLVGSLSLIGIPPTAGFLSKWYLCVGALQSAPSIFAYLIPAGLLLSAILTAGYLFKPLISAFYSKKEIDTLPEKGSPIFTLPLLFLCAFSLLFGFLNPLSEAILSLV